MFGKQFMANKRAEAKAASAQRKAEKAAAAAKRQAEKAAQEALDNDELMPALRNLGYTIAEARFALEECGPMGELEARLRRCLAAMLPPHHRRVSPAAMAAS
jgi:Holliday junction resolvasome RuvABC DNA-binding subunit